MEPGRPRPGDCKLPNVGVGAPTIGTAETSRMNLLKPVSRTCAQFTGNCMSAAHSVRLACPKRQKDICEGNENNNPQDVTRCDCSYQCHGNDKEHEPNEQLDNDCRYTVSWESGNQWSRVSRATEKNGHQQIQDGQNNQNGNSTCENRDGDAVCKPGVVPTRLGTDIENTGGRNCRQPRRIREHDQFPPPDRSEPLQISELPDVEQSAKQEKQKRGRCDTRAKIR